MGLITKDYTWSAGAVIVAAEHNANFNTIYNDYNGNITNANLSASAAIVDTKLASITTAGKVNVSALTVASQATGDFIYASSASAWARLGIGTSSQVLLGGTTPSWGTSPVPNGAVVQVVNTQTGAVATGTTAVPNDDTIPQNTEGDEYMTLAITPTSTSNKLKISVVLYGGHTVATDVAVSLYQDATANALATGMAVVDDASGRLACHLQHYMTSGTTSATTFKVRAGGSTGATMTLNGTGGGRKYGGVLASSITIVEIKAS